MWHGFLQRWRLHRGREAAGQRRLRVPVQEEFPNLQGGLQNMRL